MLVLSRKVGEEIVIGSARVIISQIRGDKVIVAVEAERSIPVHRGEVAAQIRGVPCRNHSEEYHCLNCHLDFPSAVTSPRCSRCHTVNVKAVTHVG